MNLNSPTFRLDGKVAIVTGAAQGIGRSVVRGFAEAGASVVCIDVADEALKALAQELTGMKRTCLPMRLDLANAVALEAAVVEAAERLGSVDILVNNAGVRTHKRVLDHTLEDWDHTFRINCSAPLVACQAAARVMRSGGEGGSIINVASQMAQVTHPSRIAYCSSKAALVQMTRVMAVDWAEYGIRVNALAPGPTLTPFMRSASASGTLPIRTEQVPLGRVADPDEMVGAAVYLASSASSFVTGSVLTVDGGQSVHWR